LAESFTSFIFKPPMAKKLFLLIFCFCTLISFSQISKEHLKDFKIIIDMMDSVKKINYLRFNMTAIERVEHGFAKANTKVKMQISPKRSYLINPEKKLEVLYNDGLFKGKCLVKPHVFPYFTLTLDPRGNLMRKNQHFTMHELGFDYTVKTIAMALSKEKEQIINHLNYVGRVEKNKMMCYLMVYENLSFSYFDYVVQAKETVASIANKFIVSDYMLRCKNGLYDDYGYLKVGTKIKIPTFYCKKAVFYVDEKTKLPVSVSIYDDVGLFENYDYYDLEVNKPIPSVEFQRDYKDYGF